MKLSRKLPLAFIAASLLVAAAGSVGLVKLNRSVDEYASVIAVDYRNEQAVSSMLVEFKTQVQEWKNLLLRGKDPEQLDKYWKAFEKHDKAVNDAAQALEANLPESQARTLVQQFAQAHLAMGEAYRKGFEAFKASGFDAAAGDAAVKGQDRKPTDLLNEARSRIVNDTRDRVAAAKTSSADATLASALLMLLGFLGAACGGVWLSRTITRPLEEAVSVAEQVADGQLSVQVSAGRNDETGQLLAALDRMAGNLRQMVARIRSSSDQFNAGASQIATGTVDLSSRTEQQAAALEE
ncbi:MAG TPA: methyl-accepting chemotaxis protein, partial [Telluria sp.]|nr:methyl-accepting chemotaxis protein [Telluria sp.]